MSEDEYFLPLDRVRRVFDRAADSYDGAAVLQQEVGARLLDRLDYLRLTPAVVVDLGTGTGAALDDLRKRYPDSRVLGVDLSEDLLARAAKRGRWLKRPDVIAASAENLPLADASVDMIYSNLMLPWCSTPDLVWAEIARVLKPGGALLCSTLGPDTLRELRLAFAAIDSETVHLHAFIDMHDIGDALLRHRITAPVMDAETITLAYASLQALINDLRDTGASNVAVGRCRGLGSKAWQLDALAKNYPGIDAQGRIEATVEVVYGHGWAPTGQPKTVAGETYVPLSALRSNRVKV